MKRRIV